MREQAKARLTKELEITSASSGAEDEGLSALLRQILAGIHSPPQKLLVKTKLIPADASASLYCVEYEYGARPLGEWPLIAPQSSLKIGKYWCQPRLPAQPSQSFARVLINVLNDPTELTVPILPAE